MIKKLFSKKPNKSQNNEIDTEIQKNNINKQSFDFETSIHYLIEVSNKRAWLIAFIACFIAFLSVLAIIFLTPLKTTKPYVVRIDNSIGSVDVVCA